MRRAINAKGVAQMGYSAAGHCPLPSELNIYGQNDRNDRNGLRAKSSNYMAAYRS